VENVQEVLAGAAGWDHELLPTRSEDGADAVPVAVGEEAGSGGGRQCQLAVLGARRPEVEPRRALDDQPRRQLALGDRLADVRLLERAVTFRSIRRTPSPAE
jgi:hypothetical protein